MNRVNKEIYQVHLVPLITDVSDLHRVRRIADKTVQIDSRIDRKQITEIGRAHV